MFTALRLVPATKFLYAVICTFQNCLLASFPATRARILAPINSSLLEYLRLVNLTSGIRYLGSADPRDARLRSLCRSKLETSWTITCNFDSGLTCDIVNSTIDDDVHARLRGFVSSDFRWGNDFRHCDKRERYDGVSIYGRTLFEDKLKRVKGIWVPGYSQPDYC